jgi:hypothetical protein
MGATKLLASPDRSSQPYASDTCGVSAVCPTYARCRRVRHGDRGNDRRVRWREIDHLANPDGNDEVDGECGGIDGNRIARRSGARDAAA